MDSRSTRERPGGELKTRSHLCLDTRDLPRRRFASFLSKLPICNNGTTLPAPYLKGCGHVYMSYRNLLKCFTKGQKLRNTSHWFFNDAVACTYENAALCLLGSASQALPDKPLTWFRCRLQPTKCIESAPTTGKAAADVSVRLVNVCVPPHIHVPFYMCLLPKVQLTPQPAVKKHLTKRQLPDPHVEESRLLTHTASRESSVQSRMLTITAS